jgi:hypothetical protein
LNFQKIVNTGLPESIFSCRGRPSGSSKSSSGRKMEKVCPRGIY